MCKQDRPPLLTTRSTVIPVLSIMAGVLVGVLVWATGVSAVAAVLEGITATASAVTFFQIAIDDK